VDRHVEEAGHFHSHAHDYGHDLDDHPHHAHTLQMEKLKQANITLQALRLAAFRLGVIVGPPGCGKSTALRAFGTEAAPPSAPTCFRAQGLTLAR